MGIEEVVVRNEILYLLSTMEQMIPFSSSGPARHQGALEPVAQRITPKAPEAQILKLPDYTVTWEKQHSHTMSMTVPPSG